MSEAEALQSAENIDDVVRSARNARAERLVHWFDIPPVIAGRTGIKKVGMIEMTSGEELMATRRAQGDPIRLAFELAKEAVRYVDDHEVNTGEGTADQFWASAKPGMPQLRQLVMGAYSHIHNPKQGDVAAFLESQRTLVAG